MKIFIVIILSFFATFAFSQREIVMSQYMYNKYNINPAFAGSHEALSLYASFQKQWLGFDNSPSGAIASIHTPLKKENMAVGFQCYSEKFGITNSSGFSFSYAYRLQLANQSKLSFGLSAGLALLNNQWNTTSLVDNDDPTFAQIDQMNAPWISFGAAIYNKKYFAGVSIPSLLYSDIYNSGENKLDFASIDYLCTAGYFWQLNSSFQLHPAVLIKVNPNNDSFADVSLSGIYNNALILGVNYRTSKHCVGMLGYQITNQLRATYSLDYDLNTIATYSNGTHEIGLQFDFGYKITTPNPKFF